MYQVVYCSCGEASILDGRCKKCKRVRPSSLEIVEQITKHAEDICKLKEELAKAQKLEKEDGQMREECTNDYTNEIESKQHSLDNPIQSKTFVGTGKKSKKKKL